MFVSRRALPTSIAHRAVSELWLRRAAAGSDVEKWFSHKIPFCVGVLTSASSHWRLVRLRWVCSSQLSRRGRKAAALVTGVCPSKPLSSLYPRRHVPISFWLLLRKQPCKAHRTNIYGGDAWKEDALIILSHGPVFLIFEKNLRRFAQEA